MKTLIVAMWALLVNAFPATVPDKRDIGISSTYSSNPTPSVNVNRDFPSSVAISSGYGGSYGYIPILNILNRYRKLQPGLDTSTDYDKANVISGNSGLHSSVAISSGYGGAYGYSPTSTVNSFNNVDVQKIDGMQQAVHLSKELSMPNLMLSYSKGYSGYGDGLSSYSGYSRHPDREGYGFAYASGWL